MKILIIIQARTGTTRLPGKIFLPLADKPLLLRIVERVNSTHIPKEIVVATSEDGSDDQVYDLCIQEGINVIRGHPTNLLDRCYKAAIINKADIIVKVSSDCPLIDPKVIDKVIGFYIKHMDKYDYVSNLHPATYPDGNDVEVMSFNTLYKAWVSAREQFELEKTTPYIWGNSDIFRIGNVVWEAGENYSMTHRFTIDYIEDYVFVKFIFEELYPINPLFSVDDILDLLERKPELMEINSRYAGVRQDRRHNDELKTITNDQTRGL